MEKRLLLELFQILQEHKNNQYCVCFQTVNKTEVKGYWYNMDDEIILLKTRLDDEIISNKVFVARSMIVSGYIYNPGPLGV